MPLDALQNEDALIQHYTDYVRKKAAEVNRKAVIVDPAALPIAYRRWMIDRQVMLARLEGIDSDPDKPKILSHLKEIASLLPNLARVGAFHCPHLSYDVSMFTTGDIELQRRFSYLGAVPNAYLAWEYCFSLLELYEEKRNEPGGDRKEPFEPRLTFDLYDDVLRGLASGILDPAGCFFLLKTLAARE